MPDPVPPGLAALEALGYALFVREASGVLRMPGPPPSWLRRIWPSLVASGDLPIAEASPFLENFLVDADACWSAGGERARSGPWIERDPAGAEYSLEATALNTGGRALLLIERLGEVFETKKIILQKARENVIAYQRLNAELQKKEILLHCVAEDMTASLANAITALRLIELEQDPAKTRILLGLASRALEDQEGLIHNVLDVFAGDLDSLYGMQGTAPLGANLGAVVRAAVEELAPQFSEKRVHLTALPFPGGELRLAADPAHIQRVVATLLENALQATPSRSEVMVRLKDQGEWAIVRVEDGGEPSEGGVPTELFTRPTPAATRPDPSLLRLHFCRIAVEICGGGLGYEPRDGGGNCFWIRVPKTRRAS